MTGRERPGRALREALAGGPGPCGPLAEEDLRHLQRRASPGCVAAAKSFYCDRVDRARAVAGRTPHQHHMRAKIQGERFERSVPTNSARSEKQEEAFEAKAPKHLPNPSLNAAAHGPGPGSEEPEVGAPEVSLESGSTSEAQHFEHWQSSRAPEEAPRLRKRQKRLQEASSFTLVPRFRLAAVSEEFQDGESTQILAVAAATQDQVGTPGVAVLTRRSLELWQEDPVCWHQTEALKVPVPADAIASMAFDRTGRQLWLVISPREGGRGSAPSCALETRLFHCTAGGNLRLKARLRGPSAPLLAGPAVLHQVAAVAAAGAVHVLSWSEDAAGGTLGAESFTPAWCGGCRDSPPTPTSLQALPDQRLAVVLRGEFGGGELQLYSDAGDCLAFADLGSFGCVVPPQDPCPEPDLAVLLLLTSPAGWLLHTARLSLTAGSAGPAKLQLRQVSSTPGDVEGLAVDAISEGLVAYRAGGVPWLLDWQQKSTQALPYGWRPLVVSCGLLILGREVEAAGETPTAAPAEELCGARAVTNVQTELRSFKEAALAYLILAHDKFVQVRRLVARLLHPSDGLALVHLDQKVATESQLEDFRRWAARSFENGRERVRIFSEFSVHRGGRSMLDVQLRAIALLLASPVAWEYYINLSDTHYPADAASWFASYLWLHRGTNYARITSTKYYDPTLQGGRHASYSGPRAEDVYIACDRSLAFECEGRLFSLTPGEKFPALFAGVTSASGPEWVILSRSFLEYVDEGLKEGASLVSRLYDDLVSLSIPEEKRPSFRRCFSRRPSATPCCGTSSCIWTCTTLPGALRLRATFHSKVRGDSTSPTCQISPKRSHGSCGRSMLRSRVLPPYGRPWRLPSPAAAEMEGGSRPESLRRYRAPLALNCRVPNSSIRSPFRRSWCRDACGSGSWELHKEAPEALHCAALGRRGPCF
ncbi:XYLT2 [Symbiodinium sp. CCMP2592]|nr:XYLT2 [Symbiodinium sp. CCMP2592]